MIRLVLLAAVAVAAATLLGLAIAHGSGYVLIAYGGFRFESSLWLFLLCLALLWLVLYLLRQVLRALGVSGRWLNPWSRRHRSRRRRRAAERGVLELAEGRWQAAQQHLAKAAGDEPQPLLYYFGAARAANRRGDLEGRDRLLTEALRREPRAELGIALEHAELQQQAGELERARTTLEVMHERHPQHGEVLRRLAQVLLALDDRDALGSLLPELRRQRLFDEARLSELERQAALRRLARADSTESLQQNWKQLAAAQRSDPLLLRAYAEALQRLGAGALAEEALRSSLRKHYDPGLVDLYGRVEGSDPARQLSTAEGWLREHPEDALLLRCLARLSARNRLWGKARDYYEASLRFARDPQSCAELSRLLDELGENERSRQLLRESLQLIGTPSPNLPVLR